MVPSDCPLVAVNEMDRADQSLVYGNAAAVMFKVCLLSSTRLWPGQKSCSAQTWNGSSRWRKWPESNPVGSVLLSMVESVRCRVGLGTMVSLCMHRNRAGYCAYFHTLDHNHSMSSI